MATPGEPLDVMGEVQDLKGKPIANALIADSTGYMLNYNFVLSQA